MGFTSTINALFMGVGGGTLGGSANPRLRRKRVISIKNVSEASSHADQTSSTIMEKAGPPLTIPPASKFHHPKNQ